MSSEILIFLIIGLVILALILYLRIRKIPRLGNMVLITGGIKTGKSTFSVYLAKRIYKRQVFKYRIKRALLKLGKKLRIKKFIDKEFPERPLLYSNIPLNCEYVPITRKLLLRKERFAYGSVCYICESSLVADSQSKDDAIVNERLLLFNKLYAHETKGGYVIYDTQSISDNHYAVKRCLSTYLNIHHTVKWIPFVLLMWVREMHYSEDGQAVNVSTGDVENELKLIMVPKKVWKLFDCYCYSILTDDLPVNTSKSIPVSLKAEEIVAIKKFLTIKTKKEKENDNKI